MALVSTSSHPYAFDETVGEIMFQTFFEDDQTAIGLFDQRGSTKSREGVATQGEIGLYTEKSESQSADQDAPVEQFRKYFNHTPYAKILTITREARDDDMVGLAEDLGMQLGQSGSATMEEQATEFFNNIFSTSLAEDGLSVCNGAHVNSAGGNSQTNTGVLTLTYENLKSTRALMRKITLYNGDRKAGIIPSEITVGLDLEEDLWQLVRTAGQPGNANNDMNFFRGYIGHVLPRSTWTSQWVLSDPRSRRANLRWYQRVGLELMADATFSSGNRKIGGYYRKSHGCIDWRWAYGQTGGA